MSSDAPKDGGPACSRCLDDGFYFMLPNGGNPFLMGAIRIGQSAVRVECNCAAALKSREAKP
jgi:hypothetical protein